MAHLNRLHVLLPVDRLESSLLRSSMTLYAIYDLLVYYKSVSMNISSKGAVRSVTRRRQTGDREDPGPLIGT